MLFMVNDGAFVHFGVFSSGNATHAIFVNNKFILDILLYKSEQFQKYHVTFYSSSCGLFQSFPGTNSKFFNENEAFTAFEI